MLTKNDLDKTGVVVDKKIQERTKNLFTKDEFSTSVRRIVQGEIASFKVGLDERFDGLEQKINHLPTKEEYYAREDKTMGEQRN